MLGAATAIAAPNLIVNPGFETGDSTGWSGDIDNYQVANVTACVHSGDHAATTGVFNPGVQTIEQSVASTPGNKYEISFWLRNVPLLGGSAGDSLLVEFSGIQSLDLHDAPYGDKTHESRKSPAERSNGLEFVRK